MTRKNIVVAGLGNPLMSDEGIGGFLVARLGELSGQFPGVEFVDAGTGGFSLLHIIAGRRKVVLIDCARMGTEPGTIKRFGPDDVVSVKSLGHFSLHDADVLKIIEMAESLGQCPENIIIFGIEPALVALGQELTQNLSSKIEDYISIIGKELAE